MPDSQNHDNEEKTYFEGYSDYSSVSKDIAEAVARAIDGYGILVSRNPDRDKVKRAQQAMLAAAMRLLPEIEESMSAKPELQEVHARWVGKGEDQGFIDEIEQVGFNHRPSEMLQQFAFDIRKAAFKLGYLKAGREERDSGSTDVDDKQSEQMFDGL